MGSSFKIQTVGPLRNTKNGHGVENQSLISFGYGEIYEKSCTVGF